MTHLIWILLALVTLTDHFQAEAGETPCYPYLRKKAVEHQIDPESLKCGKARDTLETLGWKSSGHSKFFIRTGKKQLYASLPMRQESSCLEEIIEAAAILQFSFPSFDFVIDRGVKNCKSLINGVLELSQNRKQVILNLERIHSPLHSVFLTDQSKYNHYLMGQMGLYINVNVEGEINKRLVKFEVGKNRIRHEISDSQVVEAHASQGG